MKSVAEGSGKHEKSQPRNRAAASEGPVLVALLALRWPSLGSSLLPVILVSRVGVIIAPGCYRVGEPADSFLVGIPILDRRFNGVLYERLPKTTESTLISKLRLLDIRSQRCQRARKHLKVSRENLAVDETKQLETRHVERSGAQHLEETPPGPKAEIDRASALGLLSSCPVEIWNARNSN